MTAFDWVRKLPMMIDIRFRNMAGYREYVVYLILK